MIRHRKLHAGEQEIETHLRFREVRAQPPGPADILLVIEVSDTTLTYDRHTKLCLCARAAIPECWIVDIRARRLEIYRAPYGDQYQSRSLSVMGDTLHPDALPDLAIEVADIFD